MDRDKLVERLLDSLEPEPQEGIAAAWADEISRRAREHQDGLVTTAPWEQVRREVRRQFGLDE